MTTNPQEERTKRYCEKYDSYFEKESGKWLESKCSNKKCDYCSKRPSKHKPHKWEGLIGKGVCK